MRLNEAGMSLLKSFEGCKLKAYRDVIGVLTIGYGHTGGDVLEGQVITQDEADKLLEDDLENFEDGVSELLTTLVTSNQFSALVCFAYNCGLGNLKSSTLLKLVNAGKFNDAALQFLRWDKAGGKVVAGLTRRRTAEKDLFLS